MERSEEQLGMYECKIWRVPSIKANTSNFEARKPLSAELQIDFGWWRSHISKAIRHITLFETVIKNCVGRIGL